MIVRKGMTVKEWQSDALGQGNAKEKRRGKIFDEVDRAENTS